MHVFAELEAALSGFLASHPSTILIDPPVLVRALDDRVSMLRPLAGSGLLLQVCALAVCSPLYLMSAPGVYRAGYVLVVQHCSQHAG
jgi:hypothetical protein